MKVSEALRSRISCRAFLPDPVDKAVVGEILELARTSASGGNLQPWHVFALSGEPLAALLADVAERMKDSPRGEEPEYRVYPKDLQEPYFSRRHKCGEDLYASIGVSRDDKHGRLRQFFRNYAFFGAPVGLFFYIDRKMLPPQWCDMGIFLQSVMLAAREHGLHTCPQEAWSAWPRAVAKHLRPPEELMLFCGMGLGLMDETAPVNSLRTERADLDDFCHFRGFSH